MPLKTPSIQMKYFPLALVLVLLLHACQQAPTIRVKKKNIVEAVYASGFVVPKNEYKLYAIGDGYVVQQFKNAGDEIKIGEAVYQIQNDNQSAKLDAAGSAYRVAQQNLLNTSPVLQELQNSIESAALKFSNDSLAYVRSKNMFTQGVITQSEFDKTVLAFNVSKNDLQSAKDRFRKSKDQLSIDAKNAQSTFQAATTDFNNYSLKSIINGKVFETYKEQGELVKRNDLIALIGDKSEKILQLSVDQQDIEKVKVGQKVIVKIDISGNKIYEATVDKIYPTMNQNEQSFRVDAVFQKGFDINFIRTSVEANIVIAQKENVLVVPRTVLVNNDKVILKNGTEKKISTGIGNLEEVEVTSGLNENDELKIIESK